MSDNDEWDWKPYQGKSDVRFSFIPMDSHKAERQRAADLEAELRFWYTQRSHKDGCDCEHCTKTRDLLTTTVFGIKVAIDPNLKPGEWYAKPKTGGDNT